MRLGWLTQDTTGWPFRLAAMLFWMSAMLSREHVANNLAAALLARPWEPEAMLRAVQSVLGKRQPAAHRALIQKLVSARVEPPLPSPRHIASLLLASPEFDLAARAVTNGRKRHRMALAAPLPQPAIALSELPVPRFATLGELGRWLDLSDSELDWFADARRQSAKTRIPVLQHYRYHLLTKRNGALRLIEAPKPTMKRIHRQILRAILDHLPAHDAAHGFVAKRSCRTHAGLHAGEQIVVTLDIANFFATTPVGRVHQIFASLGYPWNVARALTSLCTTAAPPRVLKPLKRSARAQDRLVAQDLARYHLPQGAPTSPALANLAAWRLDVRLSGLARAFDANYSRYADDLAFSGDAMLAQRAKSFLDGVAGIVRDEGYSINGEKTRVMTASRRQQMTGIVVNSSPNVGRNIYDVMKATLHNCIRHGPTSQNHQRHPDFRAHLDGRVGWVEQVNAARGAKLRRLFERIAWS